MQYMHFFEMGQPSLSDRLRARMRDEGLTQRQLALRVGVSQSQISRVLQGKYLRRSRGVRALEAFLGEVVPDPHTALEGDLLTAARAVADGSEETMQLLMQLMHLLGKMRLAPRGSP